MSGRDCPDIAVLDPAALVALTAPSGADGDQRRLGLQIGKLLALVDAGRVALVVIDSCTDGTAQRARTILDLNQRHIGAVIAVMFEDGDPSRPIVIGVVREAAVWPLESVPGQVEVEADGARLIVSALQTLVLRCGRASLTMRADGRIEINGEHIVTQAVHANRIRGGSVELN